MKLRNYLNSKNVIIILILIILGVFIFKDKTEEKLLEKLNNNKSLIDKFQSFKVEGYEKEINLQNKKLESVVDTAMSYIGVPNKVGGTNKDSIDASGLIYVSITKNSDIKFPRIAQDMARYGKIIIDSEKLKRGDLVFFFDTYEVDRIITSVGLYLGEGAFLNSSTNDGVSESDINDPYYWKDKFFFGTRIFK
tara:strand:- start:1989 stop:2567 length:579 start_codon:yes stop_codon:yes gene_type:complete